MPSFSQPAPVLIVNHALVTRLVVRGLAVVLFASSFVFVLGGCRSDKLFMEDTPRSPYARYGRLRGTEPPMTERDGLNRERPALRARLTPPNDQ